MKEKIANTLRLIILSAIFSTAIGYSLADFQAPPCAPPCGNTPPPINVGSATQVRDGVFIINNQFGATVGNFGTALIGKASGLQPIYATDPGDTLVRKDFLDDAITNVKGYVDTKAAGAGDNMGNRNAQGGTITNVATPQTGSDAATKDYVDAQDITTLASSKNYTDSKITGVGALKLAQGSSCAACPYGSYESSTGEYSCTFKKEDGSQVTPVAVDNITAVTMNPARLCYALGRNWTFGFWTY